jgi:hypothetical protein
MLSERYNIFYSLKGIKFFTVWRVDILVGKASSFDR